MTTPAAALPPLPYEVRAHVERELYTYPVTRREIADRRRHLIDGGDGREERDLPRRPAGTHADPTYFAGTALAEDRRLRELERIVGAIDEVLAHPVLPAECREIVRRWYWQAHRLEEITDALGLSRATLQRYRTATLIAIAARLGWLA